MVAQALRPVLAGEQRRKQGAAEKEERREGRREAGRQTGRERGFGKEGRREESGR